MGFQWTAYVSTLCRHFNKKLPEKPVTKEQMKSMPCIVEKQLLEKKQQDCKKANYNQNTEVCLLYVLFFSTILLIPQVNVDSSCSNGIFVDFKNKMVF